jgi:ParB family chromosome partitioning protein
MGWQSVEVYTERPDNIYYRPRLYPVRREPTEAEAEETERLIARISEIEESEPTSEEMQELHSRLNEIEDALQGFPAEVRAANGIVAYIGHNGDLELQEIRIASDENETPKSKAPDGPYSKALVEQLTAIRSLALQQAVASDPALALDILLDTLTAQLVHHSYSYHHAAQVSLIRHAPDVDEDLMTSSTICRVDAMMTERFADIPEDRRFETIRAMPSEDKMQLLAGLVASSINATIANGFSDPARMRSADSYADAAGLDLATVWTPPAEMFYQMRKGALLSILTETCGDAAAENCAKMKRDALAPEVAARLPGDWIPAPMQSMTKVAEQPTDEGELSEVA